MPFSTERTSLAGIVADGQIQRVWFDGSTLYTAADRLQAWNAATGELLSSGSETPQTGRMGQHHPDGPLLLFVEEDGARLWDLTTARELMRLWGHPGEVDRAIFMPDGTGVLSAAEDGSVFVWRLPQSLFEDQSALIARMCQGPLSRASAFTDAELAAAPMLDPTLDRNPCRPSSISRRLRFFLNIGGRGTPRDGAET